MLEKYTLLSMFLEAGWVNPKCLIVVWIGKVPRISAPIN
jgi:hypothetical protein